MLTDQWGFEVKIGDFVLHRVTANTYEHYLCSRVIKVGKTRVTLDLASYSYADKTKKPSKYFADNFIKVSEEFGRDHYDFTHFDYMKDKPVKTNDRYYDTLFERIPESEWPK
jgi:hypothetical protein